MTHPTQPTPQVMEEDLKHATEWADEWLTGHLRTKGYTAAHWDEMRQSLARERATIRTTEYQRGVRDGMQALGFGTATDAYHNLGGAIIDIENHPVGYHHPQDTTNGWVCDQVSLKTLKRVEKQLGECVSAIRAAMPKEGT